MEVKTEKVSFNRRKGYKDYIHIFPGPKFVSPEWGSPLNKAVPKDRYVPLYLAWQGNLA